MSRLGTEHVHLPNLWSVGVQPHHTHSHRREAFLLLLVRNVSTLSEHYTLLFEIKRLWQEMKQF